MSADEDSEQPLDATTAQGEEDGIPSVEDSSRVTTPEIPEILETGEDLEIPENLETQDLGISPDGDLVQQEPATSAVSDPAAAPAPATAPTQETSDNPEAPTAQDQQGPPGDDGVPQDPATPAAPDLPKLSPQEEKAAKMKSFEAQYRKRLREIAKKPSTLTGLHNPVPSFEARVRKGHQEKTEKMKTLEAEYRQKVAEIAAKDSVLKLPDNPLPSFEDRVRSTTQTGLKKLADTNLGYKTWMQQRTVVQSDRVSKLILERSASVTDMRAKARAKRDQQRAVDIQLVGSLFYGVPDGKAPRPSHSRSEPQFAPLTAEEKQRIMESFNNPIWDKSLAERADAERGYWRWASGLKARTQCAVDHHFDGPMGGQTDAQRELLEKIATEKEYWKWAASLKSSKSCTIDQAWA